MAERGLLATQTLDDRAYGLLGADPTLAYRGTVLPVGRTADGRLTAAWPQFAVDMARSAALPRHAAEGGEFSVNDVTRMGLDVGMLGSVASVPRGAIRAGGGMVDDAQQGVIRLTDEAAARLTPEERLRIAQHNAAQPVEAGGLGLPPDNTPMDRARAMGFDTDLPLYHGTGSDIEAFDPNRFQQSDFGTGGAGVYTSQDPGLASAYSDLVTRPTNTGANVMPVYTRRLDAFDNGGYRNINNAEEARAYSEKMQNLGIDNVYYRDNVTGEIIENVTFDPRNIRSRFAAFDPARSASANLLAMNAGNDGSRSLGLLDSYSGQGVIRLTDDAAARLTPEERLRIAQHNAAQPVEAGGLGLPPDNTPQMRAQAMGFVDAYHGTADDIARLDPSRYGSSTGSESAKRAFWMTDDPRTARGYADYAATDAKVKRLLDEAAKAEKRGDWDLYDSLIVQAETLDAQFAQNNLSGQNIMPLKVRTNRGVRGIDMDAQGAEFTDLEGGVNRLLSRAAREGRDVAVIKNLADDVAMSGRPATHFAALNPSVVRSRFAAFDPARSASANLLAMNAPGNGLPGLFALNQSYNEAKDRRTRDRVARETLARGGT